MIREEVDRKKKWIRLTTSFMAVGRYPRHVGGLGRKETIRERWQVLEVEYRGGPAGSWLDLLVPLRSPLQGTLPPCLNEMLVSTRSFVDRTSIFNNCSTCNHCECVFIQGCYVSKGRQRSTKPHKGKQSQTNSHKVCTLCSTLCNNV